MARSISPALVESDRSRGVSVPAGLFEQARQRMLQNEPMLDYAPKGSAATVMTAAEVAVLDSVGLSVRPFVSEPPDDPLLRSIADYMALLDTSFTTSEAAIGLRVDVSRIRQRIRERSLFGIEYDGERRLPRFQFERHQVLPGLREVIAALPKELNPLDVAQWFLSANPDLEVGGVALSPRDWLVRGHAVNQVVALARGFE